MTRKGHQKGKHALGEEEANTSGQESNVPGQTVFERRVARGIDPMTGEGPLEEATGEKVETGRSCDAGPSVQ
jgi:hypothetical protein